MSHGSLRIWVLTSSFIGLMFTASFAIAQSEPKAVAPTPDAPTSSPVTSVPPPPVPAASPGQPSGTPAPSSPPPVIALNPDPPAPTINLQPDPQPPPVARTYHVHDGFYARLNLGFGELDTSIDVPGSSSSVTATGTTLDIDFALGYSPTPGIVVGGTAMYESLSSADFDDPAASKANAATLLLGPFFDGYPSARKGFHMGGALGFAQQRFSRKSVAGFRTAEGFGIAGWIGYDFWVADEWSVGGLLRLMGTRGAADAEPTAYSEGGSTPVATKSVSLMLTTVFH